MVIFNIIWFNINFMNINIKECYKDDYWKMIMLYSIYNMYNDLYTLKIIIVNI